MKNKKLKTLSIVIPLYNEEKTIATILERIVQVILIDQIKKEIIIIDDRSTDASASVVKQFVDSTTNVNIVYHLNESNKGKGSSLHKGIALSTGEFIIVQDADLEYDPNDYNDLLEPIVRGEADVVYGSRFVGGKPHRMLFFWHSIGNRILTTLCNLFSNLNLTDMECGYKVIRADYLHDMDLIESRFGFEPEVTIKLSRIPNIRFYEVGIAYYGRTYQEGKKINYKDGLRAVYCIFKYGFLR
jgi:glycosyltransferase involved in cell wall biosynthesis